MVMFSADKCREDVSGLEAVLCLRRDIGGQAHGGVVVTGGAGNEAEIAIDHRAAVAGSLFERRSCGNQFSRHYRALPQR